VAGDRPPATREKAPEPPASFKPAVVLRLEALDDLFADLRFVLEQAGQKQLGRGLKGVLESMTGPKGLQGVDTRKPIALYGTPASKLTESQAVLMLPIADEKEFLELLENLDFKTEKDGTGLYTVKIENVRFPILFRFANGYLYATPVFSKDSKLPGKDKLPTPATVLAGASGVLSLTANLDRLPEQISKLAVSAAALQLGNLKDEKLPGETDAQQELRGAVLDEVASQVKSLLEDGGPAEVRLGIDRKKHELSLALTVAGKPDTVLAKNIAALARTKSLGAALAGKDSALGGFFNLSLPGDVVKKLGPAVDERFKKALDRLDDDTRDLLAPLAKALEATAKSGQLDVAVDVRGPRDSSKYTVVACGQVKDGDRIESALKKLVDKLPEEKRKPIKLAAASAHGVSIHRVEQHKSGAVAKAMLGDGPVYFVLRKDAVLVGLGDGALEALKSAVALEAKPASPLRLEVSLGRFANLVGRYQKGAETAAKAAFKDAGSDKVRLSVTGGKTLEVKLSVKSSVVNFGSLLYQARRRQAEE
jgi:hypothetical protein